MKFETFSDKFTSEQKKFILFIVINLIVWPILGMIRVVLPTDSLEGIFWGSLHDFGTPKHPPLAAWLTYIVYSVFKSDYSIYALCTVFIVTGFVYIYKLGKFFLDEKMAMLSAIILEGCWAYTYVISYYGFNPDVVLLCFLPMLTYYAYKAVNGNNRSDWLKLGIITGLSFLDKYQTILVIFPLFIWALAFKREIFKNIYFYLAIFISFLIFLPHLIWLFHYDFFPLLYFEDEMSNATLEDHIWGVLAFFSMQVTAILGTLVFFFVLKRTQKSEIKIKLSWDEKSSFLILIGFTPLIIHLVMGMVMGGTMRPRWGYEFLFLTGIMLFYFLPPKEITKENFNLILKLSYIAMFVIGFAMTALLGIEKNYRSRYPVSTIYNDLTAAWSSQFNSPLKYLGGYIEWTLPLTIYAPTHPTCILDTNGYKNPWIDEEDLKKSGLIVIDRNDWEVKQDLFKACPYLDKDYPVEPTEYRFKVKNALNQEREYLIYYLIVPPMNDNN